MHNWPLLVLLLSLCLRPHTYVLGVWTIKTGVENCEDERAVHWITATNTSNFVHFIFAADKHVRPPTVLVIHSPFSGSHVDVNCSRYSKNSTFRHSVTVEAATASYGVLLYQLCDYLDVDDSAKVPSEVNCPRYFGSNLRWSSAKPEQMTPDSASVSFYGTQMNDSHDQFLEGGYVEITFTVYSTEHSTFRSPYYYFVEPGVAIEIVITVDRLKVLYPKTRVAPVLFVFSNQSMEDYDDFVVRSIWSDGPLGRLQSSLLVLNERAKADAVGTDYPPAYIYFPPISLACQAQHNNNDKNCFRSASLGSRLSIAHKGTAHKYSQSIAYAYYGDRFNQVHEVSPKGHVGAREQFINLGTPGDGAYAATNYSSWSFVLSLGSPPSGSSGSDSKTYWIAATSVSTLVVLSAATGIWHYRRRRRQLASQSIVRLESASHFASEIPDSRPTEEEPVEPFLLRKTLFRVSRHDNIESDNTPLLTAPPPPYDSLVDIERC